VGLVIVGLVIVGLVMGDTIADAIGCEIIPKSRANPPGRRRSRAQNKAGVGAIACVPIWHKHLQHQPLKWLSGS
jgi:hypothetical protein